MESSTKASNFAEGCEDPEFLDIAPLTGADGVANNPVYQESELDSFRHKWRQELNAGAKENVPNVPHGSSRRATAPLTPGNLERSIHGNYNPRITADVSNDTSYEQQRCPASDGKVAGTHSPNRWKESSDEEKEQQARRLYVRGVELERAGMLYEAIQQYRRAVQLVPDIESRAVQQCSGDASEDDCSDSEEEEEDYSVSGLQERLTALLPPTAPVCQPGFHQQSTHLSALPREIMEHILYWVVGADLDTRSLHAVAGACRGLFVLSRAETIWKRACQRVWGRECSVFEQQPSGSERYGSSWRTMYLTRPQPRYNGCYVSKTSYFRSGECNFHDQNYQPWHLVSYYRLIRFFPGGVALMTTTSDLPQSVVGMLACRDPRHTQVLVGRYVLEDAMAHLTFHRMTLNKRPGNNNRRQRRHGQGTTDVADTELQMSLELVPARNGSRNWFLSWRQYRITSHLFKGLARTTEIDITQLDSFPQFAFSRVKSYNRESAEPL